MLLLPAIYIHISNECTLLVAYPVQLWSSCSDLPFVLKSMLTVEPWHCLWLQDLSLFILVRGQSIHVLRKRETKRTFFIMTRCAVLGLVLLLLATTLTLGKSC